MAAGGLQAERSAAERKEAGRWAAELLAAGRLAPEHNDHDDDVNHAIVEVVSFDVSVIDQSANLNPYPRIGFRIKIDNMRAFRA